MFVAYQFGSIINLESSFDCGKWTDNDAPRSSDVFWNSFITCLQYSLLECNWIHTYSFV
jgi:hypothetical protein